MLHERDFGLKVGRGQEDWNGGRSEFDFLEKEPSPPGLLMPSFPVVKDGTSCVVAAKARGVPLGNELKSLVLQTSNGLWVAHVPGDKRVSLRLVKKRLACPKACLATHSQLKELGLAKGRVSAVLDPVWSLRHLISYSLLSKKFVTTNNGSLHAFFRFDPGVLTQAKSFLLGSFEVDDPHLGRKLEGN